MKRTGARSSSDVRPAPISGTPAAAESARILNIACEAATQTHVQHQHVSSTFAQRPRRAQWRQWTLCHAQLAMGSPAGHTASHRASWPGAGPARALGLRGRWACAALLVGQAERT